MNPPSSSNLAPPRNRFGLGCVTFGREITQEASMAMMDFALAAEWNMFDTAAAYGGGASETIVGKWYGRRKQEAPSPLLATKALPPYAPESLLASVRSSLERLQLSALDVLYLHQWHETALRPDVLAALQSAVEQGWVRSVGASNFSAEQLERALALQVRLGFARFRFLQNIHNYAVSAFDSALHRLCLREDVARVGYSPLGAGFLTGKYRGGVPAGTRFDLIPGHQAIYFTPTAQRRLAHLAAIAERTGCTMTQLAFAWAVHHPAVSVVLVGGRSVAQLQQAIEAPGQVSVEAVRLLEEA